MAKITKQEQKMISSDLHTKLKYNMSDEQFEEYVERLGICLWDGKLSLRKAHLTALWQLGLEE
jgi:hypothetical protein